MNDEELLELAALAVGIDPSRINPCQREDGPNPWIEKWNPLTDDGDAVRLETALGLSVTWYKVLVIVGPRYCGVGTGSAYAEYFDEHNGSKQVARRMAGVKAAAEIGKSMKVN